MRVSKHRNVKTFVDGIAFASKAEAARYQELKLLFKGGRVTYLENHPRYRIEVNGAHVCDYIADFRYVCDGKEIIEDVKGQKSGAAYAMFRLKAKLMKAVHGVDIVEIPKSERKMCAKPVNGLNQ